MTVFVFCWLGISCIVTVMFVFELRNDTIDDAVQAANVSFFHAFQHLRLSGDGCRLNGVINFVTAFQHDVVLPLVVNAFDKPDGDKCQHHTDDAHQYHNRDVDIIVTWSLLATMRIRFRVVILTIFVFVICSHCYYVLDITCLFFLRIIVIEGFVQAWIFQRNE